MTLHLVYFAALRDLLGISEEDFDAAESSITVGQLVDELEKRHPRLTMQGVRIAVNEEFCGDETVLENGDLVAFIPPVSGG